MMTGRLLARIVMVLKGIAVIPGASINSVVFRSGSEKNGGEKKAASFEL
jgi:hypothetical protein